MLNLIILHSVSNDSVRLFKLERQDLKFTPVPTKEVQEIKKKKKKDAPNIVNKF